MFALAPDTTISWSLGRQCRPFLKLSFIDVYAISRNNPALLEYLWDPRHLPQISKVSKIDCLRFVMCPLLAPVF
jgi:hypothetical protein